MKVYTRTGDQGTTSLVGGTRVAKDDARLEAYGTVDELLAHVALLRDSMNAYPDLQPLQEELLTILDHLMRVSAHLAAEESATKYLPVMNPEQISFLEQAIDRMQESLPKIDKFTLPGGDPLVSLCHVARTICRRAERRIVSLSKEHTVNECVAKYINRLSDYLYVLGRKISSELHIKELLWVYDK